MFDFVEIATSSRRLIARALAEDDDFTSIENEATTTTVLDQVTYDSFSAYTESPPLLSKTAEAELYLLATNFLLCKLAREGIPKCSLSFFRYLTWV